MEPTPPEPGRTPPPPPPPPPGAARGLSLGTPPPPVVAPNPLPAVMVVIGAALVILGVFLPWVSATVPGRTVTESGFQIGNYGTLILGGFALARGLSMLRPGTFRMQLGTPAIGGLLILGFLALRWGSLQDLLTQAEAMDPSVQAALGIGVWSVVVGGLLVVVGGILATRARHAR